MTRFKFYPKTKNWYNFAEKKANLVRISYLSLKLKFFIQEKNHKGLSKIILLA